MQGKYEDNPIYNLYVSIEEAVIYAYHAEIFGGGNIDELLKLTLLNNGCKISENEEPYQITYDIIPDEYEVCIICNMLGNYANEYYDFLIFNGKKILIIFRDYFSDIIKDGIDEYDPLYSLKVAMGNSVYYDAIKKIVEVFYLTSEPMPGGLLTTAMATTQRWNQAIIAIHVLNEFKPIDENDVSDIPMEDIEKILAGNIKLQLYGIRTM